MLIYLIWQTKNTCRKFLCLPSTITLPCGNIIQTIILHELESSYYCYPPDIWENIIQGDINSWFSERGKLHRLKRREARLHKRKETNRAHCDRERQKEISYVETAEHSLRREIEDYAGETERDKSYGDRW